MIVQEGNENCEAICEMVVTTVPTHWLGVMIKEQCLKQCMCSIDTVETR